MFSIIKKYKNIITNYFYNLKIKSILILVCRLKTNYEKFYLINEKVNDKNIKINRHLDEIDRLLVKILGSSYFLIGYKKNEKYVFDDLSKMCINELKSDLKNCNKEFNSLFEYFKDCIKGLKIIDDEYFIDFVYSLKLFYISFIKYSKYIKNIKNG